MCNESDCYQLLSAFVYISWPFCSSLSPVSLSSPSALRPPRALGSGAPMPAHAVLPRSHSLVPHEAP